MKYSFYVKAYDRKTGKIVEKCMDKAFPPGPWIYAFTFPEWFEAFKNHSHRFIALSYRIIYKEEEI